MKKSILIFVCVFICTMNAQGNNVRKSIKLISDSIGVKASNETNEEAIYKLERLDELYPNQWLIKYYIAYCKFRRGLLNRQNAVNYFNQAVTYLDEIDPNLKKENADLLCLEARILIMTLGFDQSKGAEYTPKIAYLVQESMRIAPNNSRVAFVNGLYKYYMPSFCGGDKEEGKKEFERAYALFKKEPKDNLPAWNEKLFVNMVLSIQNK